MNITEQEAKNKRCPIETLSCENCLGSTCMAWRWSDDRKHWTRFHAAQNRNAQTEDEAGDKPEACNSWKFCPAEDDRAGWVEPEEEAIKRSTGHCGLAGNPSQVVQLQDVIDALQKIAYPNG